MNERMQNILNRMRVLEEELEVALQEHEEKVRYRIEGTKVRFEKQIRESHRQLKTKWREWFAGSRVQSIISLPFIYGMIVPFVLLDFSLFCFQVVCFRLYDIKPVTRSDYVVIDRHRLSYLNFFEKTNCVYCSYVNGLIAYAREIAGRTEQYWCPIKHARKVKGSHARHRNFIPYGEAENMQVKIVGYRKDLKR